MALSDAIAALFGWRRVVVYDHSIVATTIQGMDAYTMYRKQPALRAVVSFLADNVAGIPLKCYERRGDADRPRDTESDLARLLACPCRGMTTHELVRAILSDYLLAGDALCYMYDDADAPSGRWLRYIPWSWVCGKETLDGFEPSAYRVSNPYTGHRADLPAEDCIRFFSYDPRGTMDSSSAIDALKDVLSEQLSAWEYRNGVWKNGGRVSQWISRPANAPWEPGARERFAKSWKARFAGKDATDTGGTPLLEDGMRLETTTFNAREAQWQEATRLAREDVAAVYHVNPSLIWHTDGQTYASAKDNARALYADTLTPLLDMVEERLNGFLVPMLGMDPATHYCEFDLSSKLAASFEEQAGVLQSSVGGPWMLRNEARARMNLPAIEGGDELIVPLNVTEGGLASPNDTDPTTERYNARPALDVRVEPMAKGGDAVPFGHGPSTKEAEAGTVVLLKSSAAPPDDLVEEMSDVIEHFLERQSRRVLQDIEGGEKKSRKAMDDYPYWWDAVRWNRELADDLEPLFRTVCDLRGVSAMADIGEDAARWDSARTANFVRAMAERRADLFNEATYQTLAANLMEFEVGDPRRITAAELSFLDHARNRAVRGARTFATAVCGFATKEAVNQVYPRDTDRIRRTKTWRHHGSKHPRATHAAMHGETVGLDERFSNGADYPGDLGLSAEESVNCHCTMDVGVRKLGRPIGGNMTADQKREAASMKEMIGQVREIGPAEGKSSKDYFSISHCTSEMVGVIDEAIDYLPTSWLEDMKRAGVTIVGYNDPKGRSHFSAADNEVRMDYGADFLQVLHELVHAREAHSPGFLAAEKGYFDRRVQGCTKKRLNELDRLGFYEDDEEAYDVYGKPSPLAYLFKVYGDGSGFELGSFGIELFYRHPKILLRDKDTAEFVVSLLKEA